MKFGEKFTRKIYNLKLGKIVKNCIVSLFSFLYNKLSIINIELIILKVVWILLQLELSELL